MASYQQTSFLGGEWSKHAQGRSDHPRYKTAMAVSQNGFPLEEGAWTRRPGFRCAAPTHNGAPARMRPFEFKATQPYNMEFTEGHLRFLRGHELVHSGDSVQVTSFNSAAPAEILVPVRDWATNDQVFFTFGTAQAAQDYAILANRQFSVRKIDGSHYELTDAITRIPFDGSQFSWPTRTGPFRGVGDITQAPTLLQGIETLDCPAICHFAIGAREFVAVANHSDLSTFVLNVKIYEMNAGTGEYDTLFQTVSTNGANDIVAFTIGADYFIAIAEYSNDSVAAVSSVIMKWDGTQFTNFKSITTHGAQWLDYFQHSDGSHWLTFSCSVASDYSTYSDNSFIYKWNGADFVLFQTIATFGAYKLELFEIGANFYCAIAQYYNDTTYDFNSRVLIYDAGSAQFTTASTFQNIAGKGTRYFQYVKIGSEHFLFMAFSRDAAGDFDLDSPIYKWDGAAFVLFQNIATHDAQKIINFVVDGTTYVAITNLNTGTNAVSDFTESTIDIYRYDGTSFVLHHSIAGLGVYGADTWEDADGQRLLAITNSYDGVSVTQDSNIYYLGVSSAVLPAVTVNRIQGLATPYSEAELGGVRVVQSELTALLLQGNHIPQVLTATPAVDDDTPAAFTIAASDFLDGPYLDLEEDPATISALTGTIAFATTALTWTADDIGRLIRIHSEPPAWDVATAYTTGDIVKYSDAYYIALSNNTGKAPAFFVSIWSLTTFSNTGGAPVHRWTWGEIMSLNSTGSVQLLIRGPDLLYSTGITEWRKGVYSNRTGWPTCGCYHEGRFWLGGVVDNRFDASNSNDPFNFAPTEENGVVAGNNAISYTLNSKDLNPIFWMVPGLQGITLGTQGGEWLVQSGADNVALTPTNIQAHRATTYGCANIEPISTGVVNVFVQKFRRRLIEYLPDAASAGKFFGPNLSEFAKHLTSGGVDEIAYQEELAPILWSRTGDGALAGTTYRRVSLISSDLPIFNAWHKHPLGSGRLVESLCVGSSADGLVDALSIVSNDAESGVRHVEVLSDIMSEDAPHTSAFFLDDAIVPSAAETVTVAGLPETFIRFYGLWPLNGKQVTVFATALDCGTYLVTDGYVDVPYGAAGGLFTRTRLNELTIAGTDYGELAVAVDAGAYTIPCVVGFPYVSRGQTLRPATQLDSGVAPGNVPFGKTRRSHKVQALLNNTIGLAFGTVFGKLRDAIFKTDGGTVLTKSQPFSGVYTGPLDDTYSYDSMIAWESVGPYPATVAAIGASLQTQSN